MRDHVRLLGALYVAHGAMGVLGAMVILVVMGGAAGMFQALGPNGDGAGMVALALAVVGTGLFVVLLVMSLPNIIAGYGLLCFRPWARVLTLILSAFNLLQVPLGTALGVYGFWVLMSGRVDEVFGVPPRPAGG